MPFNPIINQFQIDSPADYPEYIETCVANCLKQQSPHKDLAFENGHAADKLYILHPINEAKLPAIYDFPYHRKAPAEKIIEWAAALRKSVVNSFMNESFTSQMKELILGKAEYALDKMQDIPAGKDANNELIALSELFLNLAHNFEADGAPASPLERKIILHQLSYVAEFFSSDYGDAGGIVTIKDFEKYLKVMEKMPDSVHKSMLDRLAVSVHRYKNYNMTEEMEFCENLLLKAISGIMEGNYRLIRYEGNIIKPDDILKTVYLACKSLGKYYSEEGNEIKAAELYAKFINYCVANFSSEKYLTYTGKLNQAIHEMF